MYTKRYFRNDSWVDPLILGGLILLFLIIQQVWAHAVSESRAVNAAKDAGYTNITVVDRATVAVGFRGCGKDDAVRFTIKATNVRGDERTFYVCAGYFKGGTIRSK